MFLGGARRMGVPPGRPYDCGGWLPLTEIQVFVLNALGNQV